MFAGWFGCENKPETADDSFDRQATPTQHGVRTAGDASVSAGRALEKLRDGNERYVQGALAAKRFSNQTREALATHGQNPIAALIGCADSRCPLEILFDLQPGDLFVLRNAGNTITHAEGSMVGSIEYSVQHLHTKLVLVLGHTRCGAIAGATKTMLSNSGGENSGGKPASGTPEVPTALEVLLKDLGPVCSKAQSELPEGATVDEIAAHAVKTNVFHTMEKLLMYSSALRGKVQSGDVEVHGAIYDIVSGKVDFVGQSPRQALLLES